MQQRSRLEAT